MLLLNGRVLKFYDDKNLILSEQLLTALFECFKVFTPASREYLDLFKVYDGFIFSKSISVSPYGDRVNGSMF